MRTLTFVLVLAVGACVARPSGAPAPLDHVLDRSERIVLYSPHFDEAPPLKRPFRCPAAAVHLIGFESPSMLEDRIAGLAIQVLEHPHGHDNVAYRELRGTLIRLLSRSEGADWTPLPLEEPWVALTDSAGHARFSVPPGVYRVRFQLIGFREGTGVINVRSAAGDSLHAFMDAAAIC